MKNLSEEEFIDRSEAEMRARKIYIDSGVTKSISLAFALYQTVLAERKRDLILKANAAGNRRRTWFDRYERPRCPDCGSEMMFRPLRQNPEGFQMQLVCSNSACDLVLNVNKTLKELEEELVKKNEPGPEPVSESE